MKTVLIMVAGLVIFLIVLAIIAVHRTRKYDEDMKKESDSRYYPKRNNFDICLEYCDLLNNGTHIGSMGCLSCKYNLKHGKDDKGKWIKCNSLIEATAYISFAGKTK